MYRCDSCGENTEPNKKANKVYIYREAEYNNERVTYDPDTKRKQVEKFVTTGFEIASELNYCNECNINHGAINGN